MNLVNINTAETITTVQLRDMINAARSAAGESEIRNNDFLNRVSDELDDLGGYETFVSPSNHQEMRFYTLTIEQATLVGMRESKSVRRAVLDVLKEMAEKPKFEIPTTLSGALRLAAEQAETIERQNHVITDQVEKLAIAAPAVQFVERYVETKSSKSLSDVAKVIGWKPQSFIKQLADDKVLFKRGGAWLPFQSYLDREYFTVTTGESNGHAFNQTRVTSSGVAWLAKEYGR